MKPFSQYTASEMLGATQQELTDAIRLEAIERGVKPSITLPEALKRSEWRGHEVPASHVKVWGIKSGWSDPNFGWLSEEAATKALENTVCIGSNYRDGVSVPTIEVKNLELCLFHIGDSPGYQKGAAFEKFTNEKAEEFDKIAGECWEKFAATRQAAYNAAVRSEKRKEYLRLAGGSEEIARGFWAKVEGTDWPTE